MSRQFKAGDVVHIKSEGHMQLQYGIYCKDGGEYYGYPVRNCNEEFCTMVLDMFKYCGKQAVISQVCDWKGTYTYDVKVDGKDTGWSWSPQCFEEYDKEVEDD